MTIKIGNVPLAIGSCILACSWWLWSFTQTDPNLYYSSTSFWVQFQQFLWSFSRPTIVWWYILMVILFFVMYFLILQKAVRKKSILIFCLAASILMVSNNALSHDLYNYMFNAKAVVHYHDDPHVRSAIEIAPQDDWVRFMHNVHTPAPYGRFWTYFTTLPYFLGMEKFITTFLAFKLFMAAGYILYAWVCWQYIDKKARLLLFLANPLVLIETFSSGHNDIWMMALALASFLLIRSSKKIISIPTFVSLGLILLSTQIKEATLVVLPLWALLGTKKIKLVEKYWADCAALLLLIPLVTERSQQFNPWYLIWSLSFLPFVRLRWIQIVIVTLSLTSLLRYIPFLFVGEYTVTIQLQMRMVTWSALPVAALVWLYLKKVKSND